MLHKQSPRPGAFWAPRPGAGGHDLAGSEPEQGQQSDEEAAPAHGPNLKNSKAPERYAPGPCCHFLWKKIMLSGALRRLLFSLCGDYDDALCYLFAVLIDRLVKCSTHVAVVCGIFSSQFICIRRFIHYLSHEIKRLSAGSELIGVVAPHQTKRLVSFSPS